MSINDNWLTEAVEECREIRRLRPNRERRDELDCIVSKIRDAGDRGKQWLSQGEEQLRSAIDAGLDDARRKDKDVARPDYIGPSAAQTAVQTMCERFGIEYPSI